MKVEDVKARLIKRAMRSTCRYQVSAIGLNARGVPIHVASNRPRFVKYGGGDHAEALVMKSCPKSLRTIVICRVNKDGEMRPIHPCKACLAMAEKRGVKIVTLED